MLIAAAFAFVAVIGLFIAVAGLVGATCLAARRRGASRLEVVQVAFTFLVAALAVLAAVGVAFRGPGMALAWPGSAAP